MLNRERILVTGYGPFEEVDENVSQSLAEACGLNYEVLEVSYAAVESFLANVERDSFDALLAMGHGPSETRIRVESVGRNTICARPDVRGSVQGPGPIDPTAPAQLGATLWRHPAFFEDTEDWYPGTDPGGYLCNYILFRALQEFPEKRVGFLHLPPPEAIPLERQLAALHRMVTLLEAESDEEAA